jgi:hypothetical protein
VKGEVMGYTPIVLSELFVAKTNTTTDVLLTATRREKSMTKLTIFLLNDVYVFWRAFFRVAIRFLKLELILAYL